MPIAPVAPSPMPYLPKSTSFDLEYSMAPHLTNALAYLDELTLIDLAIKIALMAIMAKC